MDIARPEFKERKRRKQIAIAAGVLVVVAALTFIVFRLRPAAPTVERGTVWTDAVKRGSMLRQVRGIGSLVPSQESVRQIPAETEATVVRIRMLPGSQVKPDTILLEMSNPQVEQAAVDAALQLKAAEAEYQSLRMQARKRSDDAEAPEPPRSSADYSAGATAGTRPTKHSTISA